MIGRVVVMQHYRNDSEHAIEAKYVRLALSYANLISDMGLY